VYRVLYGVNNLPGIMRSTAKKITFILIFMITEMIPYFVNYDLCIILFTYVINNNSEIRSLIDVLIAVFLPFCCHLFIYLFK